MGKLGVAKTVIIRLQGGLGNQLFQYAAARCMASDGRLILDSSALGTDAKNTPDTTLRSFELSVFNDLNFNVLSAFRLKVLTGKNRPLRWLKKVLYPDLITIPECPFERVLELSTRSTTIYLDGYFQDESFFLPIRRTLLQEFSFPDMEGISRTWLTGILSTDNAVSVHVRRGDYLTPKAMAFHGLLGLEYYRDSVRLMNSKLTNPHYFIFSDDPDWCRNYLDFPGQKSIVATGQKAWVDMALMSKCKHHIIANSSFSWWAAWLNDSPQKMVIAPQRWFADEEANSRYCNITPETWTRI